MGAMMSARTGETKRQGSRRMPGGGAQEGEAAVRELEARGDRGAALVAKHR